MPNVATIEDAKREIRTYQDKYRHPHLPPLGVSGIYDLFPGRDQSDTETQWPDAWPGADSAGVYLIAADDHSLVYIGKASMNNSIGSRLSSYFAFDENRGCRILHPQSWKGAPRFVATVAMESELRFEAPALEEYLISKLNTPDNTAGVSTG